MGKLYMVDDVEFRNHIFQEMAIITQEPQLDDALKEFYGYPVEQVVYQYSVDGNVYQSSAFVVDPETFNYEAAKWKAATDIASFITKHRIAE